MTETQTSEQQLRKATHGGKMRIYGNLHNRIAETVPPPDPVVGLGATILMYSDRIAATVIHVSEDKRWWLFKETEQSAQTKTECQKIKHTAMNLIRLELPNALRFAKMGHLLNSGNP